MNSNIAINNKFHLGIYAIVLKGQQILLIKKGAGPYAGMLDLPGGRPEHGETIEQTLKRELLEETGVIMHESKLFDNYSFVVEWRNAENIQESFHHMAMVYLVESYDDSGLIYEMNRHDSLGARWYALSNLTKDMLSPCAYEVINDVVKMAI